MSSLKTISILTKLANQLDSINHEKIANYVDQILEKFAEGNLKPLGEVYQKDSKHYRKFQDLESGTLVIKEVTPEGVIIGSKPEAVKPTPTSAEPSFFQKYNPFPDLASAILGDYDEKPSQELEKPVVNEAKDEKDLTKEYHDELQALIKKFKDAGLQLDLADLEQTFIESTDDDDIELTEVNEDTIFQPNGVYENYNEIDPQDLTEIIETPDSYKDDITEEKTKNKPRDAKILSQSPIPWEDVSMWQNGNPMDNRLRR